MRKQYEYEFQMRYEGDVPILGAIYLLRQIKVYQLGVPVDRAGKFE